MTRESIFDQDRGERKLYGAVALDVPVNLPVTRDGFEAMIHIGAGYYNLPVDDLSRVIVGSYIHHLAMDKNQITLQEIANVMFKSHCNSLSWLINQEAKARDDLKKKQDHTENKDNQDNVVPIQ